MTCLTFFLKPLSHRSGLSIADWWGRRFCRISGHSGLQVVVIMRWGRPNLWTMDSASSVSLCYFSGDPWKVAGGSFPTCWEEEALFLERWEAIRFWQEECSTYESVFSSWRESMSQHRSWVIRERLQKIGSDNNFWRQYLGNVTCCPVVPTVWDGFWILGIVTRRASSFTVQNKRGYWRVSYVRVHKGTKRGRSSGRLRGNT